MNCTGCKRLFNTSNRTPMYIQVCDHTFCKACVLKMERDKSKICPIHNRIYTTANVCSGTLDFLNVGLQSRSIKVILLGGSSIGKSTYIQSIYPQDPLDNLGLSSGIQVKKIRKTSSGKEFTFWVHDTSGQKQSRELTSKYYFDALGAIFMYDLSELIKSTKSVRHCLNEFRQINPDAQLFLIGNKSDLAGDISLQDSQILKALKGEFKVASNSCFEVSCLVEGSMGSSWQAISERLCKVHARMSVKPEQGTLTPLDVQPLDQNQTRRPRCN